MVVSFLHDNREGGNSARWVHIRMVAITTAISLADNICDDNIMTNTLETPWISIHLIENGEFTKGQ